MDTELPPLEFTECLVDSPFFRENLHAHEKELERTSQQIKRLVKEVKDLINAAKSKFLGKYRLKANNEKKKIYQHEFEIGTLISETF